MALSSEEQVAVVMHLASSGAQAADIKKQLKKVCGNTALPDSQLEKCVEEEKKKMSQCKETTNNQNTVRKILSKKMKMVKDGDCWRPVFVEENNE